jgi:quinone-modifying oxidoreductase subunit QmoC
MAEKFLEPDLEFIAELKLRGGETLKKCYQCATCSVVCNLTQDDNPFPRKEMVWAQWGLKDRLMHDADVWLCHQCGDCTAKCPRGAKPSSVLAAVRNAAFRNFATPSFFGAALSNPFLLPFVLAFPVAMVFLALNLSSGAVIPEGGVVYSKFMPIHVIDSLFVPAALFSLTCAGFGVIRFWQGLTENGPLPKDANILKAIIEVVADVFTHKRFGKCEENKGRKWGHLLLFFGFLALFLTTNMVMAYHYLFQKETPLELMDPVKLLGNFGAMFAFVGCTWIIARRIASRDNTTYYDWAFLTAVYLTIITGIFSELLRLGDEASLAYPVYFTHLSLVFYLIIYMPFSKFAHMLYRATAMVYAVATNKNWR